MLYVVYFESTLLLRLCSIFSEWQGNMYQKAVVFPAGPCGQPLHHANLVKESLVNRCEYKLENSRKQ